MLQQGSSHPPGSILARLQVPNLVNKKRRRMIKIDNFGYVHIVTTHTLRHKNLPAISCIFFFFFADPDQILHTGEKANSADPDQMPFWAIPSRSSQF